MVASPTVWWNSIFDNNGVFPTSSSCFCGPLWSWLTGDWRRRLLTLIQTAYRDMYRNPGWWIVDRYVPAYPQYRRNQWQLRVSVNANRMLIQHLATHAQMSLSRFFTLENHWGKRHFSDQACCLGSLSEGPPLHLRMTLWHHEFPSSHSEVALWCHVSGCRCSGCTKEMELSWLPLFSYCGLQGWCWFYFTVFIFLPHSLSSSGTSWDAFLN